ncbi:MAG: NAD(P)/FAD-dependent oxidoreductase [Acetobacteraceae bacterium]
MAASDIFTTDFRNQPYWWDLAPPRPAATTTLPRTIDVAIIGSGLTGLSAARTLLAGGRSVVVFDTEDPGYGASRRNAGYLGRTLKKSFPELMAAHGLAHATAAYRELDAALQTVRAIIAEEEISCYETRCGRFIGATSPAHYARLERELEITRRHLGFEYQMVPRPEQYREMAIEIYFGGAVIPDLGALHPGLYHLGLLNSVQRAGGFVCGRTEVHRVSGAPDRIEVATADGAIVARDVILATNGCTPRQFSWHARRVIPFTAYMEATEPLPETLIGKLLPNRRTVIDSNVNIDFVRPAPDSPRLLFGGATASKLASAEAVGRRLKAILGRIFPALATIRLSHVWTGRCAGTFDLMPHMGCRDRIWYGMGYNFAGVPMGTYFGVRIAGRILGRTLTQSVFEDGRFPTVPLYNGNPWFVPYAMRYFDWKDRRFATHGSG